MEYRSVVDLHHKQESTNASVDLIYSRRCCKILKSATFFAYNRLHWWDYCPMTYIFSKLSLS